MLYTDSSSRTSFFQLTSPKRVMLLRPGRPRAPDSRRCTSETQCCELRTTTSSTGQGQRAYLRFLSKWRCDCGEIINRDENAALNIRDQAINNLVPTNGKELTLVESAVSKMPHRNENRISERFNFSCGSITLLICAQSYGCHIKRVP